MKVYLSSLVMAVTFVTPSSAAAHCVDPSSHVGVSSILDVMEAFPGGRVEPRDSMHANYVVYGLPTMTGVTDEEAVITFMFVTPRSVVDLSSRLTDITVVFQKEAAAIDGNRRKYIAMTEKDAADVARKVSQHISKKCGHRHSVGCLILTRSREVNGSLNGIIRG